MEVMLSRATCHHCYAYDHQVADDLMVGDWLALEALAYRLNLFFFVRF